MSTFTSDGQLPVQIVNEFTATFEKFPTIGFIWRLKEELVASPSNNILFIDWIDQRALLGKDLRAILFNMLSRNFPLFSCVFFCSNGWQRKFACIPFY
jgi:hypothetical protein